MATINIAITPELAELINEKVTSGMYHSASEVVREGLCLLKEQDEIRRICLKELRKDIAVGTEQLERVEGTVYSSGKEVAEKIKAEGRRLLAERTSGITIKTLFITPAADADLLEIWVCLMERNARFADRIVNEITDKFDTLCEYPEMGRSRPELSGWKLHDFLSGTKDQIRDFAYFTQFARYSPTKTKPHRIAFWNDHH